MSIINFGIWGLGRIGNTHMRHFSSLTERYQPVAVCDVDATRANEMADAKQCQAYDQPQTFLNDSNMQLVIIATRSLDHAAHAKMALQAGKTVLLEKPIGVTEKGKYFIEQAQQVLREHEKLIHISEQVGQQVRGSFRLGIIPTLAPYVIPLFLHEFAEQYPLVDLTIDEMETSAIISAINNDEIDAGLLATPLGISDIKERSLFYEPFYLYAAKGDQLASKKRVSAKDIDGDKLWLLKDGHCLRNQILHFCRAGEGQTIYKNIHFEGANLETLRYLVKRDQGVTFFPFLFVHQLPRTEREQNVKPFVRPMPSREVGLVFHKKLWKMQILDALEEVIYESIPKELRNFKPDEMDILPIEV